MDAQTAQRPFPAFAPIEARLNALAAADRKDAAVEQEALSLLRPLGLSALRDQRNFEGDGALLSHFNLMALTLWRRRLGDPAAGTGEAFDPRRGTFTGMLVHRFRLRMRDRLTSDRHCVSRSWKSERRRRAIRREAGEVDDDGYLRLDLPGGDRLPDPASRAALRGIEARIELGGLLDRTSARDRAFLQPLVDGEVTDLKGLALRWGVSQPAVSKRLRRLRREASAWA
jgi:hypothetical protein